MKNVILIGLLVLILVAIPVTIFLVRQRQQLASQAAPSTTLSLVPSTSSQTAGQPFNVNVSVSTGENTIVSTDLVITYDPAILEATGIVMGDFFTGATEIQKSIDNTTGKIIYSFYTQATNAKSGDGTLAVVTLKGKTGGSASVVFDPQSAVGAVGGENQNVLVSTLPGTYAISGGTSTASPTASATATATATASATATATGTPNPNPTANLSFATGTSSPTATATPTGTGTGIGGTLTITSIANGENIDNLRPAFSGRATPYATVTITLQSITQTATVTADANGNWSWTPSASLEAGSHSITVVSGSQSKTVNFTVGAVTPATGVGEFTVVLGILGLFGLLGTLLIAL